MLRSDLLAKNGGAGQESMTLNDRLQHLTTAFLVAFGLVGLALLYWSLVRGPILESRADNPRLIEEVLRIERGPILDRNGSLLAETVGVPGDFRRLYHAPMIPAVGYYSLRHGVAGIEASYDDLLRARDRDPWQVWWDELIHRHPTGLAVQLTLDAELQTLADVILGDYAGSVVMLDATSGDILVLSSQPGYDPNLLDREFERLTTDDQAPLLNRATQATYQPGTAIQPLVLAAGLERGLVEMGGVVDRLIGVVRVDGLAIQCAVWPYSYEPSLKEAMRYACPAPFVELALALGGADLGEAYRRFGLTGLLELPLAVAPASVPVLMTPEDLVAEATGQGAFTVSPLQLAWAMTAIANDGLRPTLRLVQRIGNDERGWEIVVPASQGAVQSMDPETAREVARAMTGALPEQVGLDSPNRIAAHVGLAVAGPSDTYNSWFVGFAPPSAPVSMTRYLVVVLLEGTDDVAAAAEIGMRLLETVDR
jgi:penicillin-binding protein A